MSELDRTAFGRTTFYVQSNGDELFPITLQGRNRWALEHLMASGAQGCTPVDTPGPRWSSYVFDLRQLGVLINTIREPHDGPFQGTHARYVLKSTVSRDARAEGGLS